MKTVSLILLAATLSGLFVQPVALGAATYKEKVLWSFGSGTDGQGPSAGLTGVNGTLYGTTVGGGIYGDGTVFAFDQKAGTEKVLYSFCIKGEFCADGDQPWAHLIAVKGTLYGTTVYGGDTGCSGGCGTVYSLNPNTGKEKVVYSFLGGEDGRDPIAGLTDVNGTLYGTTDAGGSSDFGTAFALNRKTGIETVLYSFCGQQHCTDGRNSASALIALNGTLYGTTVAGGDHYMACQNAGCGTVYALDPGTGAEQVMYSFEGGADGANPSASLIAVNGKLYGTTYWGGGTGCGNRLGCGTVFSLDLGTGAEVVLHSFCTQQNCADGAYPSADLINERGTLYGTTQQGGDPGCYQALGCGTVFSIDPSTGAETVVYAFCHRQNCADGANPQAALLPLNGKLYGTTRSGGAYGYGTVFVLKQQR